MSPTHPIKRQIPVPAIFVPNCVLRVLHLDTRVNVRLPYHVYHWKDLDQILRISCVASGGSSRGQQA